MKVLTGITAQPKQAFPIALPDGSTADLYIEYRAQQRGWFLSLAWEGFSLNGMRLVNTPNILHQFRKIIPFGLAVLSLGHAEPTAVTDLADGSTTIYFLDAADINALLVDTYRQVSLETTTPTTNKKPIILSIGNNTSLSNPQPVGGTIRFSVTALGENLKYQWFDYYNAPMAGGTTAEFSIAVVGLYQGGTFSCTVSNEHGSVRAETQVFLGDLPTPLTITAVPDLPNAVVGVPLTLTVEYSGGPMLFPPEWFSPTGTKLPSPTFTPTSTDQSGDYTVVLTASNGTTVSGTCTVTVNATEVPVLDSFTKLPATGGVGQEQLIGVIVAGTGLSYQWYFGNTLIPGATASVYTFTPTSTNQTGNYEVEVTNSAGIMRRFVTTLTVLAQSGPPDITSIEGRTEYRVYTDQQISLTAYATGNSPISGQWFKDGTPLTSGEFYFGKHGVSFQINSTDQSGVYTCVATNADGSDSASVTITVLPPYVPAPVITSISSNSPVAIGGTVELSITATNASRSLWFLPDGSSVLQNSLSYSFTATSYNQTGTYSCVAYGDGGPSSSAQISVTVGQPLPPKPEITSQSGGGTVPYGTTTTLSVTAPAATSYQWFRNNTLVGTGSSYSFTVTESYFVSVLAINEGGDDIAYFTGGPAT